MFIPEPRVVKSWICIHKSKEEKLQNKFDPIEDYIRSSKEHSYLLGNQVQ